MKRAEKLLEQRPGPDHKHLVGGVMADSGIYAIVNLVNGKFYVGSAVNLRKRRISHFTQLRHRKHCNRHLQASWSKHGEANFQFRILARCQPEELIDREQQAIDALNPDYNICRTAGSTLGVKRSPEQCAAQSSRMKGAIVTPEHRRKISDSLKGRQFSDEERAKISEGLRRKREAGWRQSSESIARGAAKRRGRKATPEQRAAMSASRKGRASPMKGRRHSSATRAKMSAAQRVNPSFLGKKHSPESRRKMSEAAKRLWDDPEFRANNLEATLERLNSPEARKRQSAKMRGRSLTENHRAKIGCASKAKWQDTEYRERRGAALKVALAKPECRARKSAASRQVWERAEHRAKMSEIRRGTKNPAAITRTFAISRNDGETLRGIPMELRAATGISAAGMSQLISGKQATAKGWALVSE